MNKNAKKVLALILCGLMLFALCACGNGAKNNAGNTGSGNDVSTKDTLNVAITGDSGTLLPSKIMGNFVGIVRQYMEVLVDYKEDGTPVWVLATGIDEVSTSKWIIHCREDVTFSNGNKFDANDVWFTFEYYLNDPMGANFLSCLDLENSKIVDEYTIELALSSYSMQQMGSLSQIYILDAESFDADDFVMNPIGTGPYVVTDYVINSHVYLKANENYWGKKANIQKLHYKVFNEDAQMINALQSGTVDVCAVPLQDVEFAKTLNDYDIHTYYNVFAPTISFNMSDNSIMNSLDARLAVCYAADRQAMVDLAYFGYATVLDYPVSQHCLDYEARLANLSPVYSEGHNIEKAKEYAEKAGLVGKEIVVITNGGAAYVTEAEILQTNLKEIGVTVKINNYDGATYMSVSSDPTMYDIALYAVASPQGYAVGMLYEYVMWGASQYGTWENFNAYLELGASAVATADEQERSDMLLKMSEMFEESLLWYGICDQMSALAIDKDLGGVEIWNSGGMRYVDWSWLA